VIRLPLNEMVSRIREKTELTETDILSKIEEKCKSLSGLISKEGAAHIIANELGVKLVENSGKIKDTFPGMRNTELTGKVIQKYDIREFSRQDGSTGKVGSFVVGDETGTIRIVCWGDKTDVLTSIDPGNTLKITNLQVRENNRGYIEAHLTDGSTIETSQETITDVKQNKAQRVHVKDLEQNGQTVEVLGTIVQVFEPRFFEQCPECNSRLKEHEGRWFCDEHGDKEPNYSYLMNVFIDDGTENIRVVLFRNQAEKLLKKTRDEFLEIRTNPDTFEPYKTQLLGEQFIFSGRAKHNTFFDRIEFIANTVQEASAEAELKRVS